MSRQMNRVKARDFWRSPYKYLKDIPFVVTIRGKPAYVVTKYVEEKDKLVVTSENVVTMKEAEEKSKDVVTLVSVTPAPNEPPPYKIEEPWQPPAGLSKDFMTSKGKSRKDPE